MHTYSQGKYVQSMFSEKKTGQTSGATKYQKATQDIASYAVTYIEGAACDAVRAAADGIPVCKITKFVADLFSDFFDDLGNNAPSS